jgi:tetratricopeptide (TPR) repeat protein
MEKDVVESTERNLRLLSQAWYTAREDEKSIPPLERAAQISEDGELYMRLAQSHINLENWAAAAEAARQGIRLGGLKRPDQAQILLGMSLFNQKRLEQARTAFQAASRDERSARAASQWINYVDSEIKRRDLLTQELPEMQPRERDELLDVIEKQGNQ